MDPRLRFRKKTRKTLYRNLSREFSIVNALERFLYRNLYIERFEKENEIDEALDIIDYSIKKCLK